MTREFVFNLLNPAIALVFTVTFFVLWRRRPAYKFPLLLALAFFLSGLAFAANDFLRPYDGIGLRIVVNALFLGAVLSVCLSAFIRTRAPTPIAAFVVICALGAVGFGWFLVIEPSTSGRIYVVNLTFAAMAIVALRAQFKARPASAVDWLFIATTGLLLVLSISRPIATLLNGLDINAEGPLQESAYWATVQALTPILSLAIALSFLAAITIEMFNELRTEANRDYLTGLCNRRGFDLQAAAMLNANPGKNWQSAAMIVDIDNFKIINDTFGHAVGDRVIAAVGHALATHARADVIGRTGGEEFSLLYNEARRGKLISLSDAIRREIKRAAIDDLPDDYLVTVSIGIHERHQDETLSQMMAKADQALYEAKLAGKDCAVLTPLSLRPVEPPKAIGL